MGHQADVVVYRSNRLLSGYEDRSLNVDLTKPWLAPKYGLAVIRFFFECLKKYDVFHFHYGHSLFPLNVDLIFLKWFKKRVFMEYHGSDVRRRAVFEERNPYSAHFPPSALLEERESYRRQRRIAAHVDGIIVHDEELREHLYPLNKSVWVVPLRLDLSKFPCERQISRNTLVIAHAPSRADLKGTSEIAEAITKLSEAYDIDFQLVSGVSHEEAIETYRRSDIVIDQLIAGSYGMLAIESMALGKPVVGYIRSDLVCRFPEAPPIYNATVDNIFERLEDLVKDPDLRQQLGSAGRAYVERNHDSMTVATLVAEAYSATIEGTYVPAEDSGHALKWTDMGRTSDSAISCTRRSRNRGTAP